MQKGQSSIIFDEAVNEFSSLPGIGKRTAIRLVLHLLKQTPESIENFGNSVISLSSKIKHCSICHNISDDEICAICANKSRDSSLICVVENIKDVVAIENTEQFNGKYHILGGILSPMDGVGPSDLNFKSLETRILSENISEAILALSPTMEGDTTNFFLYKRLSKFNIKLSIIARGISFGDELEYTNEVTLGRSIVNRKPFDGKTF
ncbi:MAG: recombination protein RecR [Bacteroidetes bacterium 4572_117]|nr:MAG: recombination protein RecR [Bacteroidetes bacterium 4572_117]